MAKNQEQPAYLSSCMLFHFRAQQRLAEAQVRFVLIK